MSGYPNQPPNYGYGYSAPPPLSSQPYGAPPPGHPYSVDPYAPPSAPYGQPSAPHAAPYGKLPKEESHSYGGPGGGGSGYPPPSTAYGNPFASLVPSTFPPGTDPNVVACFQMADQDGSGLIDDKEMQRALSSYNQSFSLRTVHLLMYNFTNTNVKKIAMRNPNRVLLAMQKEKGVEAKNRRKDTPTVARDPLSATATSSGSPASLSPPRKRTKGSSSLNQAPASPVVTRAEPLSTVFRPPDCFLPESVNISNLLSSTLCPPASEERLAQSSILDLRDQTLTFMMDLPGRFNFVVNQLFRLKDALSASEGKVKELEAKLQKQSEGFAFEEAKLKAELGVAKASRDQLLKDVTKAEAEVEEAERKLKMAEEDLSSERQKSESLASKLEEVTTAWGASTAATVDAVLDQVRLIVGDSFDFSGVSAFKVVRDGVAVDIEDVEDEDDDAGAEIGGHSTGEVADKTSNVGAGADVTPDEVNSPPAE